MKPLISLRDLAAGYGQALFSDLSLDIHPGEFVALLGPNGAGKSTLLKVLTGGLAPMRGQVRLFDRPFKELSARQRAQRLAHLPQHAPEDAEFRVLEVVRFGRHPHQVGWGWGEPEHDRRAVDDAMHATGVDGWRDRRMGSLSGGEQQRVRLAQALAQEPEVLLLDEPTAWADLHYQLDLLALVRRLAAERQIAVLSVLHDLNHASQFCSRLLLLHGGRLAADGPPERVLTPEAIAAAYHVAVRVERHPETLAPIVIPRYEALLDSHSAQASALEGRSSPFAPGDPKGQNPR